MEKIYSKINTGLLLHIVWRVEDFYLMLEDRTNIIDPDNFIQCSALNLEQGTTFKPHSHNIHFVSENKKAQESWHVLYGQVECTFYDIDNTIISTIVLNVGDTSFTLHGGHNYNILSQKALVLEYKTGKYLGQQTDKTFI